MSLYGKFHGQTSSLTLHPLWHLSLSLSFSFHVQLCCCGYNNATDWTRENPSYLAENGGIPREGDCRTCTVGSEDEKCVQFTGTYFVSNMTGSYDFTASGIVRFSCRLLQALDSTVVSGQLIDVFQVFFFLLFSSRDALSVLRTIWCSLAQWQELWVWSLQSVR